MNRKLLLMFSGALLILASCISHDVEFEGKTVISSDGAIRRSGELKISLSGDRDVEKDLSHAMEFYADNFVPPDTDFFEVQHTFADSVLTITWTGEIDLADLPISDYTHRVGDGRSAGNKISLEKKSRWFYNNYSYAEIYSDPIDTVTYYSLIEEKLAGATDNILSSRSMSRLKDRDEARDLLQTLESKVGVNMLRAFFSDPHKLDSLSGVYDSHFGIVADSLAAFAGVKLNPDSLNSLLKSVYDSIWDTLLADHPGIFGSYGLDEGAKHRFRIEVVVPGCVINTNAESRMDNGGVWIFDHLDFFAGEKRIELAYRVWSWLNVAITVIVILIVLAGILWPIRRKRS